MRVGVECVMMGMGVMLFDIEQLILNHASCTVSPELIISHSWAAIGHDTEYERVFCIRNQSRMNRH